MNLEKHEPVPTKIAYVCLLSQRIAMNFVRLSHSGVVQVFDFRELSALNRVHYRAVGLGSIPI